jgi:hypothetical protein
MAFLQDLFAPDHVPSVTDPSTGQHVVDVRKVSEKLGLDPAQEMSKVMTDPVLSTAIVVVNPSLVSRAPTHRGLSRANISPTRRESEASPVPIDVGLRQGGAIDGIRGVEGYRH